MHKAAALLPLLAIAGTLAGGDTRAAAQQVRAGAVAKPHPAQVGDWTGAVCASCHEDITQRQVLHGPAVSGPCTTCHVATSTGATATVGLISGTTGNTAPLCLGCHEDMLAALDRPHVHAPVAAGACTACHDPHGSAFPAQLRAPRSQICFTCHEDVAATVGQKVPHAPAAASCVLCHDPHASRFPRQTRQGLNTLCLTCHAPQWSEPDFETPAEERAWQRALAAAGLSGSQRQIKLDASGDGGHPVSFPPHPVRGIEDPLQTGRELSCVSCHNPHGAALSGLFRFEAPNLSGLCVNCHNYW